MLRPLLVCCLGLVLAGIATGQAQAPVPPATLRIDHTWTDHGDERSDPYAWLRDRDDPRVLAHLQRENRYAADVMTRCAALRDSLFAEMKSRRPEDDCTVPSVMGAYEYWSRTVAGKPYRVLMRRQIGRPAGPDEVILDPNVLAAEHDHWSLGSREISPDGRFLAYGVDVDGSERHELRIRDLATGRDLDGAAGGVGECVWGDSATLYYTTLDSTNRGDKLYRHVRGTPHTGDVLVHEERDASCYLHLMRTTDGNYVLLSSRSGSTTEYHALPTDAPASGPDLILPRRPGVKYDVTHAEGRFYVRSNANEPGYEVYELAPGDTTLAGARTVVAGRPDSVIEGFEIFADAMVVTRRTRGQQSLTIIDRATGNEQTVTFSDPIYTLYSLANREYDTPAYRVLYTSLTRPNTVIDIDLRSGGQTVRKVDDAGPDFDATSYRCERLTATAEDGTRIPISVVYRPDMRRAGGNPTLIYGYGAYGITIDPVFSANNLSLLDRGYVYAIAHVRGGGYLGDHWFQAGRLEHKANTFSDFICCTEHLAACGLADPRRIAIEGGSAGGLLMGTVTNLRPELFQAVLARVPWVDVLNDLLDLSLPGTPYEHGHLGDPRQQRFYDLIRSYTPYENVTAQCYPDILATAGLNDPRVFYWEPAKWIARLRDHDRGDSVQLLAVDLGGGHGVGDDRDAPLRKRARELAFILEFNRP